MTDDNNPQTTNRRRLLKTISAGALASTLFAGAASADDGVGTQNCERDLTYYRCVETDCDCCGCDCDCKEVRERKVCCEDRYGNLMCGPWQTTSECCTSC